MVKINPQPIGPSVHLPHPSQEVYLIWLTTNLTNELHPAPQPSLTTEYTPIQRGGPPASSVTPSQQPHPESTPHSTAPPLSASHPSHLPHQHQQQPQQETKVDDGVDTSTLPEVTAPPSHPAIDPTQTGVFDGRSILEVDINALADKPWRRPGSDISDWFNYGFDELSWDAYIYRRRDLGEMANVLKTNVIVSFLVAILSIVSKVINNQIIARTSPPCRRISLLPCLQKSEPWS